MDAIIERITLYDVLGYFAPGSLVMIAVCGMILDKSGQEETALYQNYESLFVYAFILLSYFSGILLSEISRKIMGLQANATKLPVPDLKVRQALIKSGIADSQGGTINIADYLEQMYNDIQSDSAYKRLHNYASAEVLCKNLALAVLISAVILCAYFPKVSWGKGIVLVMGLVCMRIVWGRAKRFARKKLDYTVCSYVGKYLRVTG